MRQRWECVDCRSHTFVDECVNCGSGRLREVEETPGDRASADAPLSPGARKWQRDMLENGRQLSRLGA